MWSDRQVVSARIRVVDVPFVAVGGGLGSFVMVDYLRIAGVPVSDIRVLTVLDQPWQNYAYLTAVSQIPRWERLRSDSSSCPDNIWAFPSYAVREAFASRRPKEIIAPLWNVLTENVLCDYWTPKAGDVFQAMKREADRIGYWENVIPGQVLMTHRRDGGGYFTLVMPRSGPERYLAYRSRFVHFAVGYPGLRFLDDLQAYRSATGDHHRVVNAYEPHEHVYEELRRRGGTVLVRGGGIVASRILDRLISDRDRSGADTQIAHLLRTYVGGAHGRSIFMRRRGGDGWAYQGFNWPKSTWGGQAKSRLQKLEGEQRVEFLRAMGGTTTARRKGWRRQLERGRAEGFYQVYAGEVEAVVPGAFGTVVTCVKPMNGQPSFQLPANFVIDATGLVGDISEHPVLADLLEHGGAGRNVLGRLDVERTFELRGCRNDPGRLYASGATTLGGYLAGVDTFLGLQIAALETCDDLARLGFCHRIGLIRSTSQWVRWLKGTMP
ncbi:MAG: hypothetical protein M3083_19515 [Actinomycetota bacterium]|nr:hypothetical protein [Actinomycetota bacterium]